MTRTPPKIPRPWPVPLAQSALISSLGDRPTTTAVAEFWQHTAATLPLVEQADDADHVIVTFCWRDTDAEQVLLFVNRVTDETSLTESLMRRIDGTDIWHLSYRMRCDWRASYSFVRQARGERAPWTRDGDQVAVREALDLGNRDPRNDDVCRNRAGVAQSVVSLPGAPDQPWLDVRDDVERGAVIAVDGPGERTVWVHRPTRTAVRRPVVVILDGDVWTSTQSLPTILDNLIDDGLVPEVCAVMVDSGDRETRWRDLGASGGIDRYIVDELLPWAREELGVSDDPEQVVVVGQSLGGLSALRTGLRHPGVVGHVIAQSASLWWDDLITLVETGPRPSARVRLEVGELEWVLLEPHRALVSAMEQAGIGVDYVEFNGGHDYACWRGGLADALADVWRDHP